MEIKSFILPIDRKHFLNALRHFDFDDEDDSLTVIRYAIEDWFFSHDCNVCVKLDDVKLPKSEWKEANRGTA